MTVDLKTRYLNRHIASLVIAMPSYATLLPGGIHRQIAPPNTAYPFMSMDYQGGVDKLPLNTVGLAVVSGGILLLLKVHDQSQDESDASNAYIAVCAALTAGNNLGTSGAYCCGNEETPVDLPNVVGDQVFQQIGGTWRYWVDPILP